MEPRERTPNFAHQNARHPESHLLERSPRIGGASLSYRQFSTQLGPRLAMVLTASLPLLHSNAVLDILDSLLCRARLAEPQLTSVVRV